MRSVARISVRPTMAVRASCPCGETDPESGTRSVCGVRAGKRENVTAVVPVSRYKSPMPPRSGPPQLQPACTVASAADGLVAQGREVPEEEVAAAEDALAIKLEAETVENAYVFEDRTLQLELAQQASVATVALPSGPATPRRLPDSRKRKFQAHLETVFAQASSQEAVRAETTLKTTTVGAEPAAKELGVLACRLCQGGCCTQGGDKAYLSAATVRRMLHSRPESSPSALLARYLQAIPEHSEQGSCIYHTEFGCNLPGELRAKLCHQYFCEPLKALLQSATRPPPQTLIALTRRQDDHHSDHLTLPNEITEVAVFARTQDAWRRQD